MNAAQPSGLAVAVGVDSGQEAKRPGDATNVPGRDTEEVTSMPDKRNRDCTYCEGVEATHRVRWTVYGGATKTVYACEKHVAVARGQRGLEIAWLCPHGRPCPEDRLCACSIVVSRA